jgi:NAD(P)-dependent dehydrogenase (short-subunit alcohol dehydrogenase family)
VQLLVLGGTDFLGRALGEAALERGDEVATFTRGKTNPDLFPEAERLRGDRDGDLRTLEGRAWEAVVDLSGWVPDEFLLEQGVGEWMEVPLWIASDAYRGMMRADVSGAVAAGLTVRPLVETARAALHEAERAEGVGLTAEREAQLLAAWSARA